MQKSGESVRIENRVTFRAVSQKCDHCGVLLFNCFFVSTTTSVQGLHPALCFSITPVGAENGSRVSQVEGKNPFYCTISPVFHYNLEHWRH